MEIRSKAEFFRLWRAGVLGNRTKLSTSIEEAMAWKSQDIGFREVGKAGGGSWTKGPRELAPYTHKEWSDAKKNFIMDDSVPNEKQTIMGEICRTIRGWEGLIGATYIPMRPAIKAGLLKPRKGAAVLHLIREYMDPSSQDDLHDMLELYPDATVEFSCFSVDVGNIPGRNTMFWEVRNY